MHHVLRVWVFFLVSVGRGLVVTETRRGDAEQQGHRGRGRTGGWRRGGWRTGD